ncbi:MAG: hypothetical protein U0M12_08800 [Acutalibacteraceae bacterium]|nr:hypothetical protein [Acutalibacteraceae bacterium]
MKKIIATLTFCFMIILSLTACGSNNGNSKSTSATDSTSVNVGEIVENFKVPAEVVKLNLDEAEPKSDDITFEYDESGRISGCYYSINGKKVYVGYEYKDNSVQVFGFVEGYDYTVASEEFKVKSFNSDTGFCEYNGYYFKGVEF